MVSPLHEYILSAIAKGYTENQIEKLLISKGWDKITVNRAILDVKFGSFDNNYTAASNTQGSVSINRAFSKKKIINIIAAALLIAFISVIIVTKFMPDIQIMENKKSLGNAMSGKYAGVGNIPWCTPDQLWSDDVIQSTDALLVRGSATIDGTVICIASSDNNPQIEYQFTQDNQKIWQNEPSMTEDGTYTLNRIQIK